MSVKEICKRCDGKGKLPGKRHKRRCPVCKGLGYFNKPGLPVNWGVLNHTQELTGLIGQITTQSTPMYSAIFRATGGAG